MSTTALIVCEPLPLSAVGHDVLRFLCPNCTTRMLPIRAIERPDARPQHVYKCPRCSIIMTERPE